METILPIPPILPRIPNACSRRAAITGPSSFQKAELVYDITFRFAHKVLARGDRTIDQMICFTGTDALELSRHIHTCPL